MRTVAIENKETPFPSVISISGRKTSINHFLKMRAFDQPVGVQSYFQSGHGGSNHWP